MIRLARALRILADRIDPPARPGAIAHAISVPVYINGREILRAIERRDDDGQARR